MNVYRIIDNSMENEMGTKLAKANDVIGQFITSCSHSMRGPLKSIQGLVSLLMDPSAYSETERRTFLNLIASTTLKMENMLDELEHFLENSKREVVRQKIDIEHMVHEILDAQHAQIAKSGTKVKVKIEQHHAFYNDPNRLRLVITNLVNNALLFYDESKPVRTLTIYVKTSPHDIFVSITDNGIGIVPEIQGHIFKLFYRGSERSGGAGIGLYVVKEVLQKMGGNVLVDSEPGVGSKFFVKIPSLD